MPIPTNDDAPLRTPETNDTENGISDADMAQAGELYEDVNDLFRLTQRAATLVVRE